MRNYLFYIAGGIFFCLLIPANAFAQDMVVWEPNLNTFSDTTALITNNLLELSSPEAQSHPEFGKLPYDAPCTDCIEVIDKRTIDSRYYVSNTDTNEFYVQKSMGYFHYTDEAGRLISYDPRLKADSPSGSSYTAEHQETPTKIDVSNQYSAFLLNGTAFKFNRKLKLKNITSTGEEIDMGAANWSEYTAGDNGIYITNAWPGVDLKIIVKLYTIESDIIIKNSLGLSDGYLVLEDKMVLPDGYNVAYQEGELTEGGWSGSLKISSADTTAYYFEMGKGLISDSAGIRETMISTLYEYVPETKILKIKVPVSWLNDATRVYPVTIDPLVTSSATYSAGVMKFRYKGTFCTGPNPDCSYILSVPLPANSTLTAAVFSSQYNTVFGSCGSPCFMADAAFQIDGPCGTSPSAATWWTCPGPTGFAIGTCTAVNYTLFSSTVSCLTPVCSGTVDFTIRNSYCFCSSNGSCPADPLAPCTKMNNNTFSITISGRNLEVPTGGTVTSSCCVPVTLNAAASYGVPPYSYAWTTGATSSSISVFSCANSVDYGPFTFTCTVTDACGVVRTLTYTLNVTDCGVLPIQLVSFSGYNQNNSNYLQWVTQSEKNNAEFNIERSADGQTFNSIGSVNGAGNSTSENQYSFVDENPDMELNYYRLKQVDINGDITYSEIIVISSYSNGEAIIKLQGENPVHDYIDISFNSTRDGNITYTVSDIVGTTVLKNTVPAGRGVNSLKINVSTLPPSSYILQVNSAAEQNSIKLIKQ